MASPLLGYNNNIRHHGKLFHIQTEDSGTQHAHIFTHLFADGGRIIATKKTNYGEYVGTPRFPDAVKKLMQAQHKAMIIALRDGLFDLDELQGAKDFALRAITLDEPKSQEAQLDLDALERAAASYLSHSTAGGITSPGAVPAPPDPPPGPQAPPTRSSSSSGRYQATQPVKPPTAPPRPIPKPQTDSLFGDGLLSEKSLDEVIMSYLAEDLDSKDE